jgi:methyl halide transferase
MEKNIPDFNTISPETEMAESYWNNRYGTKDTGWDLGEVSPPLKTYIDQIKDKNLRILIPGCGNSYEASYLLQKGFTNITLIDIATGLVHSLKKKFINDPAVKIICGDFFTHEGEYDLILEQTFFCALHHSLRTDYVTKMHALLAKKGKLAGVLFNREFEQQGPPFGGNEAGYRVLFDPCFNLHVLAECYNSHGKRAGTELFIIFGKK